MVTARAPGKVNLALVAGAPRADGYHPLATVFQALSLTDDVSVVPAASGRGVSVSVLGEGADLVPVDASNVAWRAAELVAERAGVDPDVEIRIRKGIPVAGGMAGGSADAAAALVACNTLWDAGLHRDDLDELARDLGADVPFALHGGTALGLGRGDVITPVLTAAQCHWVLALADEGLSTPSVFAELDRMRGDRVMPEPRVTDAFMAALRAGDCEALAGHLVNDLEPAALVLRPQLQALLAAGSEAGALASMVSGSGPTCAFLVRDPDHAVDIAAALTVSGLPRAVRIAHGPVPGARVISQ